MSTFKKKKRKKKERDPPKSKLSDVWWIAERDLIGLFSSHLSTTSNVDKNARQNDETKRQKCFLVPLRWDVYNWFPQDPECPPCRNVLRLGGRGGGCVWTADVNTKGNTRVVGFRGSSNVLKFKRSSEEDTAALWVLNLWHTISMIAES